MVHLILIIAEIINILDLALTQSEGVRLEDSRASSSKSYIKSQHQNACRYIKLPVKYYHVFSRWVTKVRNKSLAGLILGVIYFWCDALSCKEKD